MYAVWVYIRLLVLRRVVKVLRMMNWCLISSKTYLLHLSIILKYKLISIPNYFKRRANYFAEEKIEKQCWCYLFVLFSIKIFHVFNVIVIQLFICSRSIHFLLWGYFFGDKFTLSRDLQAKMWQWSFIRTSIFLDCILERNQVQRQQNQMMNSCQL